MPLTIGSTQLDNILAAIVAQLATPGATIRLFNSGDDTIYVEANIADFVSLNAGNTLFVAFNFAAGTTFGHHTNGSDLVANTWAVYNGSSEQIFYESLGADITIGDYEEAVFDNNGNNNNANDNEGNVDANWCNDDGDFVLKLTIS